MPWPLRPQRRDVSGPTARLTGWIALASAIILQTPAMALDISGVQNAALDQPRINALIRLPSSSEPLIAIDQDPIFGGTVETFNIQAFFDTGASGVLISTQTATALGLPIEPGVIFEDVGVADSAQFQVSQEVIVQLAPFDPNADIDNLPTFNSVYNQSFGPLRTQIGPVDSPPLPLLEGLDVLGMPLFAGKTVIMDARPVNAIEGTMNTYVVDSQPNNPDLPRVDRRVQMSYASFDRFTRTLPSGSPGPTLNHNPFIGPSPTEPPSADDPPGITITYNGLSSTGSWLFDTGAAASIISQNTAAEVGVRYRDGRGPADPDDPDAEIPLLETTSGQVIPNQFLITIGGIGGSVTAAGFFLDSLLLPTMEGNPNNPNDPAHLRYLGAPVLVLDITTMDPDTHETLTLDGVFGMNFLVASIFFSEPFNLGDIRAGAFDFLVFDEPSGVLSLTFASFIPEPGALTLLGATAVLLLGRRTRKTAL